MTVATTAAVIFFMKLFDYVDEVDYRRRSRLEHTSPLHMFEAELLPIRLRLRK